MQTLAEIRRLLDERGLTPKRSLGQNFLIDHNLIRRLVDASGVGPGSLVLEVGPGTGTMTEELLDRGASVVACELDDGLASLLEDRLGDRAGFTLVRGDCLESKREVSRAVMGALGGRGFVLVSNLPYGAGTPLMLALMTRHPECSGMWVTVQREVADRLLASPGSDEYGSISVVASAVCAVRRVASLPPECFWPRPEVSSAMVELIRRPDPLTRDPSGLADLCRTLFASRRKQIGAVLRGLGMADRLPPGVDPTERAENLPPGVIVSMMSP